MSRTPTWVPQHITDFDGFRIVLKFSSEHFNMRDHFMNDCGWSKEQYEKINNFYWFTAEVCAYKGRVCVGSAYLGANCYESLNDVLGITKDNPTVKVSEVLAGYAPQLIAEAVEEAKTSIKEGADHLPKPSKLSANERYLLLRQASRVYLTEPLPTNYNEMEGAEVLDFIKTRKGAQFSDWPASTLFLQISELTDTIEATHNQIIDARNWGLSPLNAVATPVHITITKTS